MRVSDVRLDRRGRELELSARVDQLPRGMPAYRVWFCFPEGLEDAIRADGSPFFVALLPTAARLGVPLHVEAAVDARLLTTYPQALELWTRWYGLPQVEAEAAERVSHEPDGAGAACFFSGGVDSFYTVLENHRAEGGPRRIRDLLFVAGFDVPLENTGRLARIGGHIEVAADALGLRLWRLSSNISRFTASWAEIQHGPSMAGVGLALGRGFRFVFIPASHTYAHPIPWGSHPLLDPLWSSTGTCFVHAGCEAGRVQKVFRIAECEVALAHLRVCNDTRDDYNCARCHKCLRTMIALRMAGALERCPTLPDVVDLDRLRALPFKNESSALLMEENLVELRRRGGEPEIRAALEHLLGRWRYRRALERLARPLSRMPQRGAYEQRLGRKFARAGAATAGGALPPAAAAEE